ncbi:MAG: carbon-nitrogen family hydrolase [Acidobacteriia bacterium]|nr:carbon-nitrogen family hydrolase [Terriglobia bacterium]
MGLHVVACQLDIAWEDKDENHRRVAALLDHARPPEGSLVVLPEMFSTGFSMNVDATAEGDERPSERFLAESARRLAACTLGGVVTREGPGALALNEAVAFGPDGSGLARYGKIHPFSFAGEDRRFARGREVVTFVWGGFTIAPFVCYDLRFPEVFRAAALRGANVLVVIANWPAPREAHWLALLTARAIENQAYVVGVNRCGRDPHAEYSGHSRIIDPRGRNLAEADEAPGTIEADLDLEAIGAYRREFPVLEDADPRFVPGLQPR